MTTSRRLLASAPILMLCAGGDALAVGPTLLPDHPIDAPALAPAASDQDGASIAFGAGTYVAVWRSQPPAAPRYRVFASRAGAGGTATDSPPLLVGGTNTFIDSPSVAFDGTNFVIAWQEQVGSVNHIVTRTLTPAGQLVEASPVDQTPTATLGQGSPVAAAGGGQTLILWEANVGAVTRIRGRLLGSGPPVDLTWPEPHTYRTPMGFDPTQDASTSQYSPAVAFGNGRFLVGFIDSYDTDGPDLYGGTVQSGTVNMPVRLPTDPEGNSLMPSDLAIGFGGNVFVVAWDDFVIGSSQTRDIWARICDSTGAPSGSAFAVTTAQNAQGVPQVAFGGGSFLVAWEAFDPVSANFSAIVGTQVSTTGGVLRADTLLEPLAITHTPLLPPPSWRASAIASDGTDFVVAWSHQAVTGTKTDVLGSPVTSASIGAAPGPGILSRGPNQEQSPAAASNGSIYLVVWEDTRTFLSSGMDLYGMRVGADGLPIDGAAIPIATTTGDQASLAVAARPGGDFLVTWVDPNQMGDIHAVRVSANGTIMGGEITIAQALTVESDPAVATAPTGWLVAWHDRVLNAEAIRTVRVDAASGMPDATVYTVGGDAPNTLVGHPTVAFDGTDFLVAFEQKMGTAAQGIGGAWLTEAGTPTGVKPTLASGSLDLELPSAAGSAGHTFIAWDQPSPTLGNDEIAGILIATNQNAPMGSTIAFADLASLRNRPRVAMQGPSILVAWNDARTAAIGNQVFAGRAVIDMMQTLRVIDGQGYPVVDGATIPPSLDPAVAMLPDGRALYVVQENVLVDPMDAEPAGRVHVRAGGVGRPGDTCANDGACDSAHCVGNVCCENACNGICQTCGSDGRCDIAPRDDGRCIASDCAGLATECVDYMPAARCEAFGVCRLPGDPAACVASAKPDGVACAAVGCVAPTGVCMRGTCVCASYQPGPTPPTVQPEFANPGCAAAGAGSASGGSAGWLVALVIGLLAVRRRRHLLAALVLLGGCTEDKGGLIVQLALTGQGARVDHVRFILSPTSAPGFPTMTAAGGQPAGVTVFASDVEGDGIVDQIVDVDKAYIRGDTLSIELTPRSGGAFGVSVRAWAIDSTGNRFARALRKSATVKPGETPILRLELECLNLNCASTATAAVAVQEFDQSRPPPTVPAASIAAGRITVGSRSDDVLVGFPGSPPGGGSQAVGEVHVFLRPRTTDHKELVLTGAARERFGAAVATGAFDPATGGEVVVGAPGAAAGDGAIYVVQGGDWVTAPAVGPARFNGIAGSGEQLGSALAVADVDGDGKVDLVAGAPFGKRVYVFLQGKPPLTITELGVSGFGSAVAAARDGILVGAPESNRVRLYRLSAGNPTLAFEWTAPAGAFGAAVALADVDGDGRSDLVAAAPAEGAGVVYVLRAADLSGSVASTQSAYSAVLRSGGTQPSFARLGQQLAALRTPTGFGDSLALSAPGGQINGYLIEGATLLRRPALAPDDVSAPVAKRIAFSPAEHDLPLAAGDVDGDGTPEIVSVTSGGLQIVEGVAW